jgi:hypothetical protein
MHLDPQTAARHGTDHLDEAARRRTGVLDRVRDQLGHQQLADLREVLPAGDSGKELPYEGPGPAGGTPVPGEKAGSW